MLFLAKRTVVVVSTLVFLRFSQIGHLLTVTVQNYSLLGVAHNADNNTTTAIVTYHVTDGRAPTHKHVFPQFRPTCDHTMVSTPHCSRSLITFIVQSHDLTHSTRSR